MTLKSCAVGMRNAIPRNHVKQSKVGSILISADDILLDNVDSYTYLALVLRLLQPVFLD